MKKTISKTHKTTPRHKTLGKFIKRKVVFTVKAPMGSTVFLAGSFNAWSEKGKQMTDKNGDGTFTATCYLMPGRYEYKYIINGIWIMDTENPDFVANDKDSMNSVLVVE